jgi:hypothetical protein
MWDGQGWTVQRFTPVLGIGVDAWDLYLIYGPEVRWDGPDPPKPMFWMHQLQGVDEGPLLDADVFGQRIRQSLAALPR